MDWRIELVAIPDREAPRMDPNVGPVDRKHKGGRFATAVCVLVGPVFVPFFIVPKMEWLFWGWFRCFIQYAFYQVIAAAVVFVIANLIVGVLRLGPPGAVSTSQLIGWFPVLFITFLAAIYALLKIPALTNHIFSGSSGASSASIFGGLLP